MNKEEQLSELYSSELEVKNKIIDLQLELKSIQGKIFSLEFDIHNQQQHKLFE